jgi:hypothetical protein
LAWVTPVRVCCVDGVHCGGGGVVVGGVVVGGGGVGVGGVGVGGVGVGGVGVGVVFLVDAVFFFPGLGVDFALLGLPATARAAAVVRFTDARAGTIRVAVSNPAKAITAATAW